MYQGRKITKVIGREILDSRGNPTVEVEVELEGMWRARAAVPSGASTGRFEAVELRDGGKRYHGQGVTKAIHNIHTILGPGILGVDGLNQREVDRLLLELDGTEDKSVVGANATLGVSMAVARVAAKSLEIPLYQYLGGIGAKRLPVPMMNILNGGRHADNTVDLQEFMIMPVAASCFSQGLEMCANIYHTLKGICKERGLATSVGDEGGFAPNLADSKAVLSLMIEAIREAGYEPKEDICIAIDAAASELYVEEKGVYYFPGESKMRGEEIYRDVQEMVSYYEELIEEFPIISIEDGLYEDDFDGWEVMTKRLGKIQLVGDDLFVTNTKRLKAGIQLHIGNAILIKVNQIGTLSEAFDAIELAHKNGYHSVISHRSGETEDSFIADIAVATNAGQIKTGAPCRSERVAKYNQLLRIEEQLKECSVYENVLDLFL